MFKLIKEFSENKSTQHEPQNWKQFKKHPRIYQARKPVFENSLKLSNKSINNFRIVAIAGDNACLNLQKRHQMKVFDVVLVSIFWTLNNLSVTFKWLFYFQQPFRVYIWDEVFKNGPSKIYGRQPLKNLKGYTLFHIFFLKTNWFILQWYKYK